MNVYNVLTLNDEASISVVDPLFGFGGTKLLGMVVLESPGEDWVMTSNETRIYVSLPDTKKVAVVDTAGWAVSRNIELDRQPGRVALQPDESLLWVADHKAKTGKLEVSGIVAIETTSVSLGAVSLGMAPTGRVTEVAMRRVVNCLRHPTMRSVYPR